MKTKTFPLSAILMSAICSLAWLFTCVPVCANIRYSINEGWRFSLGDGENRRLKNLDDSKWTMINIPHTWNDKDANDDEPGYYRGTGWYRKSVYIDKNASGKIIMIYFDGANQSTTLYVNEQLVGVHKGGYTRFCFDITQYVQPGSNNLISVKLSNADDADIPPLSADFTFFGGIYRNVYLQVKEKTSISNSDFATDGVYIKTRSASEKNAEIEVQTLLDNHFSSKRKLLITQTIIQPDGREILVNRQQQTLDPNSYKSVYNSKFSIQDPLLWSPDSPNLYMLKTRITDALTKEELASQLNSFGIRWFSVDANNGFMLNGRSIKLIGTSRHQCYLDRGNALPDEFHIADIKLLKDMGANMLRVAHYPQDPLIMETCDKLGIITSVEIPIVNEITESNAFLQNSLKMAEEMVKQNFNHPSVIIWSYMNEVMLRQPFADDPIRQQQYHKEINRQASAIEQLLRKLDPDRYTMIPFHGSLKNYEEAGLMNIAKMAGLNLYQGWYGGTFSEFDSFVDKFHQKYPSTPFIITEYGADVDQRLHSFKPERFDFTVEYGDLYHEHYIKTLFSKKFITGGNIWNLNDFSSESRTDAVPHVNLKGITTRNRKLKNSYFLYKTWLSKTPVAFITSKFWKYRAGINNGDSSSVQPVKIYSNLPFVDIYHNGQFLKRAEMTDKMCTVQVPFSAGKNTIEVKQGNRIYDYAEINFTLLPSNLQKTKPDEINVLLGSNRYFEDPDARLIWIPEQPYTPGSWGYTGGHPVRPSTKSGSLPANAVNILNTNNDPVFQTQRQGIQSFRFDVTEGQYAVYLYWADLSDNTGTNLLYNLENNTIDNSGKSSVMNIDINSVNVLSNFDLRNGLDPGTAVIKKFLVDVMDKNGISINLHAVEGSTILNAIRLVRLN